MGKPKGKKSSPKKLTKIEKAHHSLAIIYYIFGILVFAIVMVVLATWYAEINSLIDLFG